MSLVSLLVCSFISFVSPGNRLIKAQGLESNFRLTKWLTTALRSSYYFLLVMMQEGSNIFNRLHI
jgi:hypothetical protein